MIYFIINVDTCIVNMLTHVQKTCMFVVYVCKILLKILNIKSKFFMYESVIFRSGHPVLTLIAKLHKDSSIHICKRMLSCRLQSSYIRKCPGLGCNLLDVVLMGFFSKCLTKSSIGNPTQKNKYYFYTRSNEMKPKIK